MAFQCGQCGKEFKHRQSFNRHKKAAHAASPTHRCETCDQNFTRLHDLKRHQQQKHTSAAPQHECDFCGKKFPRADKLREHKRTHDKQPTRLTFHCRLCNTPFNMVGELQRHREETHPEDVPSTSRGHKRKPSANADKSSPKRSRKVQPLSPNDLFPVQEDPLDKPEDLALEDEDPALEQLYKKKWSNIRTHFERKSVHDMYNFRINSVNVDDLTDKVWAIFRDQKTSFKINLSYGFVLRNNEGELRYYYPCENNHTFLEKPVIVDTEEDLQRFLDQIANKDILEYCRQQRPDSKWIVHTIPHVEFYISKLGNHPIGAPKTLPAYIVHNKAIVALQSGMHGPFDDNLCFFRCLASHYGKDPKSLETATKDLFRQYLEAADLTEKDFYGVSLEDLADIEKLFQVDIYVYSLRISDQEDEGDDATFAQLVRRPLTRYKNTMYLNLYEDHFSYIKDFKKYAKSYGCPSCGRKFKRAYHLKTHQTNCIGAIQHDYPGGAYNGRQTVFEQLDDVGIHVDPEDRYYPYRATYDIECYFKPLSDQNTDKMTWVAVHELMSVSVCSNVPGFMTPKCFVSEGDPAAVADKMLEYLQEMSEAAYEDLTEHFADVFEQINSLYPDDDDGFTTSQPDKQDVVISKGGDEEGDCELSEEEEDGSSVTSRENDYDSTTTEEDEDGKGEEKQQEGTAWIGKLLGRLHHHLRQLPVIGFNSGKYDVNAMKKVFLPLLHTQQENLRPIKKDNNFMSIETDHLKFLDLINYVAPGFSYSHLLKAYECRETKGFFPYEWMDDLNKLEQTSLPPADAFYSKLDGTHISPEDYVSCQKVWEERGMKTMKDFLIWYNNKDVVPMLEAIQKMVDFYRDLGIDMLKDGISVPGLTLKYLFMNLESDTYFTLVDKEDVYKLFKENIVGGPSIIFHRYHQKGETFIRQKVMEHSGRQPKLCQKVIGFDANALYLWSLMQNMPTGYYIRRKAETEFVKDYSAPSRGRMATEWLDWVAHSRDIVIRNKFNSTEKLIGHRQVPVDGFCSATAEIFQFHGCFWHGHDCCLTEGLDFNPVRQESMTNIREVTKEMTEYLRGEGYNVIEMWECQWQDLKRTKEVSAFLTKRKTPTENRYKMSETEILQAVREDELFGVVECDIQVPAHLRAHFSEMPPIFKNCDINIDDIGPSMKQYAETHGIMSKPRRSLIGSMFGQKILLATPLLKWYLNHGLEVTHVYQVLEYIPRKCFEPFGQKVSDARRDGDKDDKKKIIAETMKLIGNSAYGKTVTNKEKQSDVCYCDSAVGATQKINAPCFKKISEVVDGFYEIETGKRKIKFDLPLQIGFFVYQYAKLRMLQFYFDFMLEFVDISDFQYCEMDTDSAYIAISADRLEDVIKPHMRARYENEKHLWFPRTDNPEHAAYDKRTPGLFKEEWSGDAIVGLCSKTYYCFGGDDKTQDKFSCKGVSKRQNDITLQKYLQVLETQKSGQGVNRGFRVRNNQMLTYTQTRDAFSYFYPKRQVEDDGVTTLPLDI
ncbi:hypothetical protein Bbelb_269210 [Branchiostoma belcheri]|nr:hypothetical protein Bbelb_269210 [Branchiostoma belcheri]